MFQIFSKFSLFAFQVLFYIYNKIFAALSNASGFVTLDALVAKTGAGSKKSVVTRITEMESILGRNFNKVTVATGASKGASQVAYSI